MGKSETHYHAFTLRESAFKTSTSGSQTVNGEQLNDHIEVDDHTNNVVEDDGTNTLINDSFNVRMDGDEDNDNENDDDFDDVHDIPLLDKEYEPLVKAPKQIFSLLYC